MFTEIKTELKILFDSDVGRNVGLFFSGGSDSLLLLRILLDMEHNFSIVTFDHSFSRAQRDYIGQIIDKHKLRVFSYPPMNAYLIGTETDKVSVVEEYVMLGGAVFPFVRDVTHNPDVCAMEDVQFGPFSSVAPIGFSLNLFGLRKSDRHWSVGKVAEKKINKFGKGFFYYPLWDLNRNQVAEGLQFYGEKVPKLDTGEIQFCKNCLCPKGEKVFCPRQQKEIAPHQWNPSANLEFFRKRFQI